MNKFATILLVCIMTLEASAQMSLIDVTKKYNDFRKVHKDGARLHLVFNQDRYTAGDTAWFKVYFLNSDMSPVKGRQLVNFGLVSPEGVLTQHFLFGVTDGIGSNQVILPVDASAGIYSVAAYNSWMKNFAPPPLFKGNLVVVSEKTVEENKPVSRTDLMLATRVVDDRISISFSANEGSMLRYQELLVLVTNDDKIQHATTFRQGVRNRGTIDVKAARGINYISVLDKIGRVVATSSLEVEDVNPGLRDITVRFEGEPTTLSTRQKAKFAVALVDNNNRPIEGEFSVRVLNHAMFRKNEPSLDSAFSIAALQIEEPWRQILEKSSGDHFIDFTTDLSRKGTAFFGDGSLAPAGTKLVFYLQQHDIILQAYTSQSGRFTLSLPDLQGKDELIAIGESRDEDVEGLKIVWDEKSIDLPVPPASHETTEPDDYGVFSATTRVIEKSFGFYANREAGDPVQALSTTGSELEERLKGVDVSVDVRKFVTFGTMIELIREIIPSLQSRTVKGKTLVQVALSEPMPVSKSDPLFIIDGIVTRDADYFLAMKPNEIATVKVVRTPAKLIPLGLIGKNGIVFVETIKRNARPPVQSWQIIEGINTAIKFNTTFNEGRNIRRPDFRSTIFWAPTVKTDKDGRAEVEFSCSDDVGELKVRIDGITKDGRVFSGERVYKTILGGS
jgi:hypothetical protein